MNDVAEAIARLQARFLARAAEDLVALKRWSADPSAPSDELRRLVHRLSGGAGTFGFHQLSRLAGAAEDALIADAADRRLRLAEVISELECLTAPAVSAAGQR